MTEDDLAQQRDEVYSKLSYRARHATKVSAEATADWLHYLLLMISFENIHGEKSREFESTVRQRLRELWMWSDGDMQLLETMARAMGWQEGDVP